jgi:hypothetical protein
MELGMMLRRAVKVTRIRPEIIFLVLDEKGDTHKLLWLNKNFLRVQVKE